MSAILSLINPKQTKPTCTQCANRFQAIHNRDHFQFSIANFVKQQSSEALLEQLNSLTQGDNFDAKLEEFAESSLKNLSQIVKQNAVVQQQFLAPFYPDTNNHQKFSNDSFDICLNCKKDWKLQRQGSFQEAESFLDNVLSNFMTMNKIITIKASQKPSQFKNIVKNPQGNKEDILCKLDKKQHRLLSLVLNLERYSLSETLCQNLVKKKTNEQPQEITKKIQITKKKLEKVIKKLFIDIQLELEISKFDPTHNECEVATITPEQIYETQMQKFIISPFSDRLQNFLTDIFNELNFSEKLVKDLKDAKKLKRKKNQSAHKKTPVQSFNQNQMQSLSPSIQKTLFSSPLKKQKNKIVHQEAQTQTEFKIPIEKLGVPPLEIHEASQASQSLLQKRTFSQNFSIAEPQVKTQRSNRMNKILMQASQSQVGAVPLTKQPSDPLNSDLYQMNISDSMFLNSMNTVKTETMQPPQSLPKSASHVEIGQRQTMNIISQKKVCAQDSQMSSTNNLFKQKSIQNFKMIDMRKRPNPQKVTQGSHRLNFRASQITTSRVKSNSYLTKQVAQINAKSMNEPSQSQKQSSVSLLLKEDWSKSGKDREPSQKNSFLDRMKNRNQNTQQTQGSTQTQGVGLTQATSNSGNTKNIQQMKQIQSVSPFSLKPASNEYINECKALGLE